MAKIYKITNNELTLDDKELVDKKSAGEKSANKELVDKKPANKKFADKKSVNKELVDKKPADIKPADIKPADIKSVDKELDNKELNNKELNNKELDNNELNNNELNNKLLVNDWENPHKHHGHHKKKLKIVIIISCSLFLILIGVGIYFGLVFSKVYENLDNEQTVLDNEQTTLDNEQTALDNEQTAIATDDYEQEIEASSLPTVTFNGGTVTPIIKPSGTVDIILLGLDNRNNKFTGRSDVSIFMRINMDNSKIKLVSLMRDTLVKMKGHSTNKLNTSYRFGGISLVNSTLHNNFGLEPDYYIVVNFYGMEDIIDALGGVEIDIKSNERYDMNKSIKEVNNIDHDNKASYIKKSGKQTLNGRQAVAYMRIRHVGNGDAQRIKRQQTVLSALFSKAKDIGLEQIPGLINTMSHYVRTNIPISKMLDIASAVKGLNVEKLEKYRYPDDYRTGNYKGMSVVQPKDFKEEVAKLHEFLEN